MYELDDADKVVKMSEIVTEEKMVDRKSWDDFRDTGLLFLVNTILHTFGWAIVLEVDNNEVVLNAYPARVKFRGFSSDVVENSYRKISSYINKNSEELLSEANQ